MTMENIQGEGEDLASLVPTLYTHNMDSTFKFDASCKSWFEFSVFIECFLKAENK